MIINKKTSKAIIKNRRSFIAQKEFMLHLIKNVSTIDNQCIITTKKLNFHMYYHVI